jgi:LysR family cyn operon transcriptional activator
MDRHIVSPRAVRYLLAVAEHSSFSRAAELLHVSQPNLSQQIKQLEESLEVRLFNRNGRAVRLTAEGEVYLNYARRALVELEAGRRAIHQLRELSRGSLQLAMTPITEFLAAPLLEEFIRCYPGVAVNTVEMSQCDIEAALAEGRIDLGIAFTNTLSTKSRSLEIDMHILFIETLQFAVGADHPLAGRQSLISGDTLEEIPLVFLNPKFALRRLVDLYCVEHGITPRLAAEATSLCVIMEMVRLGRLATVLPSAIVSAQYGLYPVTLLPELPHHTITLICRSGAYKSPACQAFAELAVQWSARRCKAAPSERLQPAALACNGDVDNL